MKKQLVLMSISLSLGLVAYWQAPDAEKRGGEGAGKPTSHDDQTQSERKGLERFALALSKQSGFELGRLERILNEVSEGRLKPFIQDHPNSKSAKNQQKAKMFQKLNAAASQSGILFQVSGDMFEDDKSNPTAKTMATEIEMEREFLEVSLWVRSKEGATPQRLVSAVNKDQVTAAEAASFRAHSKESEDEVVLKKAFDGQPFIKTSRKSSDKKTFWIVLPVGSKSEVEEVITANIDASFFGKLFSWDLADGTRAALLLGDSTLLATSREEGATTRTLQEIFLKLDKARKQLGKRSAVHPAFSSSKGDGNVAGLVALAAVSENSWVQMLGINVLVTAPEALAVKARTEAPSGKKGPVFFLLFTSFTFLVGFLFSKFSFWGKQEEVIKAELQPEPELESKSKSRPKFLNAGGEIDFRPSARILAGAAPFVPEAVVETPPEVKPIEENPRNLFWYIHDGARTVGPLTVEEVAQRLFVQEIDFDCECWLARDGVRQTLSTSGIFIDPTFPSLVKEGDSSTRCWIYDGTEIRGPFSREALLSAIELKLIPSVGLLCEDTTINGWKPLHLWLAEQSSGRQAA